MSQLFLLLFYLLKFFFFWQDTKKTAANDDCYFVFEDVIIHVLVCLLHDTSLTHGFDRLPATPLKGGIKGGEVKQLVDEEH